MARSNGGKRQTAKAQKSPATAKVKALQVASRAPVKVARPSSPGRGTRQTALPQGPEGYRLEDQVGFRLRRAHQRASVIFNDVMSRFDVTPTQFAALAKLHDVGPISQNQLGRLTAMDPATILGVVGRLVRQNLARARPEPEDQRLIVIELTIEGRTQVEAMKAAAAEVSRRTLAPLSPAEARQLNDLLGRLG
jgi:DNA-binding MarR family transcriptional regulator